jgi:hypothetical protein
LNASGVKRRNGQEKPPASGRPRTSLKMKVARNIYSQKERNHFKLNKHFYYFPPKS